MRRGEAGAPSPLRFGAAESGASIGRRARRLIGAATAPPPPRCAIPCAGCGRSASPRPSTAAAHGEPAVRNGAARERGRRRSAYEAPNGSVAPGPVSSGAESKRRRCPRSRAVTLLGGRGVAPRGGLQHAPRAHAAGADEKPLPAAAHRDVHLLEVRPPEPLRLVVGVAHVVADGALFAADVARARPGAGCVARGRGACTVRACGGDAGSCSALPLGRPTALAHSTE